MGGRRRAVVGMAGALLVVAVAAGSGPGLAAARVRAGARAAAGVRGALAATTLQIFHGSPLLVRAGEPVIVPVDVVCVTASGMACPATVSIRAGAGLARRAEGPIRQGLRFDLTGLVAGKPAGAGEGAGPAGPVAGSVPFAIAARDPAGRTVTLPAVGALRVYVAAAMRAVAVPAVPFGRLRDGTTVLALPWGRGAAAAGLDRGPEQATVGPPAFDVDADGRVYLLDALQGRLAVFGGGRLVRQTALDVAPRSDLSVAPDGTAWVLTRAVASGLVRLVRVDPAGRPGEEVAAGDGPLGQVRAVGGRAYARLLPMDAWVAAGPGVAAAAEPSVGRPLGDGTALLRVAGERTVRLGIARGERVEDAVELRFASPVGEVALAEPDGRGGYVMVARVYREGANAADQFQVVLVSASGAVRTFAVSSAAYAEPAPSGRFRLGPDGALYRMTSSPEGVRIVRHDLGGTR